MLIKTSNGRCRWWFRDGRRRKRFRNRRQRGWRFDFACWELVLGGFEGLVRLGCGWSDCGELFENIGSAKGRLRRLNSRDFFYFAPWLALCSLSEGGGRAGRFILSRAEGRFGLRVVHHPHLLLVTCHLLPVTRRGSEFKHGRFRCFGFKFYFRQFRLWHFQSEFFFERSGNRFFVKNHRRRCAGAWDRRFAGRYRRN